MLICFVGATESVDRAANDSENETERAGDKDAEERTLIRIGHEDDRPEKASSETDSAENYTTEQRTTEDSHMVWRY